MKKLVIALGLLVPFSFLNAKIVEKAVEYEQAGTKLEGFHAYDDAIDGQRPAILIIHQWTGLTEYEIMRARMLAEMGYNVFAADIYGVGIRPQPPEAGKYAGKYKADRELYRARMMAGLEILKNDQFTAPGHIAAIGYCFGGTGVLELARAGADLAGVVSFHGGLGAGEGMEAKKDSVPAKILCLHGALDPHVPANEVAAFEKEMNEAEADWQLITFSGAVHAFTQKMAGDDASKGAAYNAKADARSWEYMQQFFAEIFDQS